MGILDSLRQKKEIEQLKKAVRDTPSPSTFVNLIKKYCEVGEDSNALEVAQNAMNAFPDSETIFELYYRLKKAQAQGEIENLKKIIQEHPTPVVFAQLAELYKDLRDEESAVKYCKQAIGQFPYADSCYLIMGELRLRRFYKDPLVKDGTLAIEFLEKACEINNRNYKALLLLGKLYLQIGAITKAKQKLKSILLFAPEDENAKKWTEVCNKIPRPPHEDIDLLLQTIESQRKLYYNIEEGTIEKATPIPSEESIQKILAKLKCLDGILCVLVCDEKKNWIAEFAKEGHDIEQYRQAASLIYETVKESSRQMDIGRCEKCQIEGAFGTFHIIVSGVIVYIIFASPEQKQIQQSIQKILEMK